MNCDLKNFVNCMFWWWYDVVHQVFWYQTPWTWIVDKDKFYISTFLKLKFYANTYDSCKSWWNIVDKKMYHDFMEVYMLVIKLTW